MGTLATHQRVERMIRECGALGIEPESRTAAEIMVDHDFTADRYENHSPAWGIPFVEYEKAAAGALARLRVVPLVSSKRRAG